MSVTVRQLAALVQGQVHGDAERVITAARPVTEAVAGDVTFIEDEKHLRFLAAVPDPQHPHHVLRQSDQRIPLQEIPQRGPPAARAIERFGYV